MAVLRLLKKVIIIMEISASTHFVLWCPMVAIIIASAVNFILSR